MAGNNRKATGMIGIACMFGEDHRRMCQWRGECCGGIFKFCDG